ncbi:phage tail tape measure protein [Phenylobacterium sp.]|uniref:phage tail tape measure protein n=1 Tax=Phenylobacterium sp. TaxID=1871053 RepID=UPI0035B0F0A2
MSSPALIGALRVVLGLDAAKFEGGLNAAQAHLRKTGRQFEKIGSQMQGLGQSLSLSLTAPLLAFGAAALKASSDFESSMIKVGISTKGTADELRAMEVEARKIGKATIFSAGEAADAMDMLAKTGLSVTDILGGAAEATVNLAAAAGSELEPAASAISDSMQQFRLSAEQLPGVVNQITGAVNESKLDFKDFTLAIGQAGGVAANLGVSFEDFNAVLAGTSSLFASGSDAGTSFKTFLTAMVPRSKQAAQTMAQYGLSFHDANGGMKSMSDIAQMLQTKLGGLSDAAKTEVLTKVFGTDAMRTALGLMQQGGAGLDALKAKIAETDAAAQSAERMTGFAGQLEQLKGSLEELGIAIGKSGLLEFATQFVAGLSGLVDRLSEANPAFLKFAVVAGAVAAAVGPAVMLIGGAISAVGTVMGLLSAPVTLPIVGAVAAVAAAFAVFGSTIIPALETFGRRVGEVLGPKIQPLFAAVQDLVGALAETFTLAFGADTQVGRTFRDFGELVARVMGATLDLVTGAVNTITNVVNALGALLRGDFSGAWTFTGKAILSALQGIGAAFNTIFPELVTWVRKAYEGVRDWLGTALPKVFDAVKRKVEEVGDAFFQLYDRVVGHSYVPDMVEGVAAWMAKLDAGMVAPAKGAAKKTAAAFEALRDEVARIMGGLLTEGERAIRDYRQEVLTLRDGFAKGAVSAEELADALERLHAKYLKISAVKVVLPGTGEDIVDKAGAARDAFETGIAEREESWSASLERMGSAWKGMFQELVATGKVNWQRLLLDMLDNWDAVVATMKKAGSVLGSLFSGGSTAGGGGVLGAIGKSLSSVLGGVAKGFGAFGGSILNAAKGIGGAISGALGGVGSAITGALGGLGGTISGVLGGVGAALGPLMSALGGPIGIIAGLGAALLKPKPSNQAALATFDGSGGYAISGNKRTSETEGAAKAAADAVQAGQAALEAFGISLTTTVRQIDIGTRDLTHVFLSNGQELRTAVGDPAAAAEAALKAVLQGAAYTSDAQRQLVESMLAAGQGFDAVATALQSFAAAQLLPKQIGDEILKLTDPRAYDTQALVAEQQARRAELEAQFQAGMLTAEQFAAISAQLTQLEGLQLGELGKQYASQLTEEQVAANAALDRARSALQAAYQKSTSELQSQITKLRSIGDSLKSYSAQLLGQVQSGDARAAFDAAEREFNRVAALAQLGNDDAMRDLQKVGDAYIQSSEGWQDDALGHLKVIGAVLNAVQGASGTADRQASIAERQLSAMEAQYNATLGVQESVDGFAAALSAYGQALAGVDAAGRQWGLNPESNKALASATGYKGDFGAGGWQAWILQQDDETKAVARHILQAFGQPERIVGFSTGGSFRVGGMAGIDKQLVQLRASRGEIIDVSRPGQIVEAANAVRELKAELIPAVIAQAARLVEIEKHLAAQTRDGVGVRDLYDPDKPITVKVAS